MERKEIETSAFVTSVAERPSRPVPRRKRPARRVGYAGFLAARLGICALLLCGVIALKLSGDTRSLAVFGSAAPDGRESDEDERLGRLRFVELPSIIDVFAPSQRAILPCEAVSYSIGNDGLDLILRAETGADVRSPVNGKVADIGFDEILGDYVGVSADEDTVFTIYGLGEISVERGQPIVQDARIGSLESDTLTVRIFRSGRPISPAELLSLGRGA